MASFSPIGGLPVAGEPGAAVSGPPTAQGTLRALGMAVARLTMGGTGSTSGRSSAGGRGRMAGGAAAPLTWWVSRRSKSYLGR